MITKIEQYPSTWKVKRNADSTWQHKTCANFKGKPFFQRNADSTWQHKTCANFKGKPFFQVAKQQINGEKWTVL